MKICGLSEFLLCLPLVKWCFLGDFLYRVAGISDPNYLTEKLDDLWYMIPESPSKDYVRHYYYYHFQKPTIAEIEAGTTNSEVAQEKIQKYHSYINSRRYQEEQAVYLAHLQALRERLMAQTKDSLDT